MGIDGVMMPDKSPCCGAEVQRVTNTRHRKIKYKDGSFKWKWKVGWRCSKCHKPVKEERDDG